MSCVQEGRPVYHRHFFGWTDRKEIFLRPHPHTTATYRAIFEVCISLRDMPTVCAGGECHVCVTLHPSVTQ
jgi:hypothetical protein